ncbi:hypothetical protein DSO57_1026621 [Entomophthora muscae]|uniref:Uncharacterized protein n=1 Tax=Entomophthora muscae TaxID=34485 RepID=A0ACC2SEL2_9FUNG|nr:hypothetical protein DSO57_1026621 [Entomophthora muscae]
MPSSPTNSIGSSLESGYDSIMTFRRRKLSEDTSFADARTNVPRTCIASNLHPRRNRCSPPSLRRSTSTLGLKMGIQNCPLSNHSVTSVQRPRPSLTPCVTSAPCLTFTNPVPLGTLRASRSGAHFHPGISVRHLPHPPFQIFRVPRPLMPGLPHPSSDPAPHHL